MSNVEQTGVLPKSREMMIHKNSVDIAKAVDYDVLIEMTPLEFSTGQIATTQRSTVANKGPLAWHYRELKDLAKEERLQAFI